MYKIDVREGGGRSLRQTPLACPYYSARPPSLSLPTPLPALSAAIRVYS